jgi:biotin carboxyl carrier protein
LLAADAAAAAGLVPVARRRRDPLHGWTNMARITVKWEIAGKVWKIETQPGQQVADGDELLILESMKMEIPVLSTGAGTVAEILVREEDAVAEGQDLVHLDT